MTSSIHDPPTAQVPRAEAVPDPAATPLASSGNGVAPPKNGAPSGDQRGLALDLVGELQARAAQLRTVIEVGRDPDPRAPDPDRDCPHGHQLGKCDTCELRSVEAELQIYEQRAQAVQAYVDRVRETRRGLVLGVGDLVDVLDDIEKRLRGEA